MNSVSRESIAKAIYEIEPSEDSEGLVSWEQAKARDAGVDSDLWTITSFAYKAADAILALLGISTANVNTKRNYPEGSLGPHDEGALQVAVAHDSQGRVHFDFGKDVTWFAIPQETAINFGKMVLRHAGAKRIEIEL
jgi:hypothetical protein